MKGNYRQLAESVRARLNPDNIPLQKSFTDELATITYSDVAVFVRYAMKSPGPEYTRISKEAGENAKTHLDRELTNVLYKYQGSVMTNTHVSGNSDIDLLAISDKSYGGDWAQIDKYLTESAFRSNLSCASIQKLETEKSIAFSPGSIVDDLRAIRNDSERILTSRYDICDISKPKSIKLRNQNLRRDVDVVIANWYDDVQSVINDKGDYRGIQIYDKDNHSKENPDYPFLSIRRINERGDATSGRLRKMIRFLKNIRNESDQNIQLTSFDINAVCYDIVVSNYQYSNPLQLVRVINTQLRSICNDTSHADRIVSVDGREYIFRYDPGKLGNLRKVLGEVESIYTDLHQQITTA